MATDKKKLLTFIRAHGLGVVSTVSAAGAPESALVNIAVTDDLELVFYALQTTRKCANLRRDPRIAAVIGWDDETSLQYEGIADEPRDEELERIKWVYRDARPDAGVQMVWPGLTYFRVRPKWCRFSYYGSRWSVEERVSLIGHAILAVTREPRSMPVCAGRSARPPARAGQVPRTATRGRQSD